MLYELRDVSHSYGDHIALTISRWGVSADTVTGVVGPNGSGKSTLLALLGFANRPTSGEIRFHGHPCEPFDNRVRGKVALLTQDAFLLRRSVYNNIAYGLKINNIKGQEHRRVSRAMEMVGLDPNLFQRRPWYALSGGEARRVALAARLALEPEVLLMDEPTASVDATSAQMIREAAMHARRQWGTTLIITSHDSEWLADISDQLLHLFRGRILGNRNQTLIFGPWSAKDQGGFESRLADDQYFLAHGMPAEISKAVAAIEARHMTLYVTDNQVPPQQHRLRGLLLRLNYEQSTGRISAAVRVGQMVFNVYLGSTADDRFNPGQNIWLGYDPRSVVWY